MKSKIMNDLNLLNKRVLLKIIRYLIDDIIECAHGHKEIEDITYNNINKIITDNKGVIK